MRGSKEKHCNPLHLEEVKAAYRLRERRCPPPAACEPVVGNRSSVQLRALRPAGKLPAMRSSARSGLGPRIAAALVWSTATTTTLWAPQPAEAASTYTRESASETTFSTAFDPASQIQLNLAGVAA